MIKKKKIKVIKNPKGKIIKFVNYKELPLKKIEEIYFSEVKPNKFKGWKFHNSRNQYLTVVTGSVEFSFKKKINSKIKKILINSEKDLYSIFIPKKVFYSFKCNSKSKAIIINIIDEIVK